MVCDAPTLQEAELQQVTVKAINLLVKSSSSMLEILMQNIKTALADGNAGGFKKVNAVLSKKQKELVKLAHAKKIIQPWQMKLTEYDESMVRKYIDKIKVYEDKFTVCFKAGVDLDIER